MRNEPLDIIVDTLVQESEHYEAFGVKVSLVEDLLERDEIKEMLENII